MLDLQSLLVGDFLQGSLEFIDGDFSGTLGLNLREDKIDIGLSEVLGIHKVAVFAHLHEGLALHVWGAIGETVEHLLKRSCWG